MYFLQRLLYYCLLFGTSFLACFYVYTGLFKRHAGENPFFMKQSFALSSILVLVVLYKAFQLGEVQGRYWQGLVVVLASWLVWALILLAYLLLAKAQGRW
jgi:hypothetical protein